MITIFKTGYIEMSGKFITLEGGEGVGKSTQAKRLAQWLTTQGKEVVLTREPGGTVHAEAIRELVVKGAADRWLPVSELLLYTAARYDHIERLIKPAMLAGKYVICDRFTDSTIAYQGWGHGISIKRIEALMEVAVANFKPDLTLVLDIDVSIGLQRTKGRTNAEDRYEKLETEFHQRVRQGFLSIAKAAPDRCVVIDAVQELESVTEAIYTLVKERCF
jgi:dTMP kinase